MITMVLPLGMLWFSSRERRVVVKFFLEVDASRAVTSLWGKLKHHGWDELLDLFLVGAYLLLQDVSLVVFAFLVIWLSQLGILVFFMLRRRFRAGFHLLLHRFLENVIFKVNRLGYDDWEGVLELAELVWESLQALTQLNNLRSCLLLVELQALRVKKGAWVLMQEDFRIGHCENCLTILRPVERWGDSCWFLWWQGRWIKGWLN
jgi:hypothetical protein